VLLEVQTLVINFVGHILYRISFFCYEHFIMYNSLSYRAGTTKHWLQYLYPVLVVRIMHFSHRLLSSCQT